VHREASPVGPPFFEFIASRILRKKMFYDFDDALWKKDISTMNPIMRWLRSTKKPTQLSSWFYGVVAGNDYLGDYAAQYNSNVHVIPTCVNTDLVFNRIKNQEEMPVNIGWTGTHTTLKYIRPLMPVLESLHKKYPFTFYLIADNAPDWTCDFMTFVKWRKESEVADLLQFHIGLMPLPNDEWAKGKCGFTAIQYLSLGIPAVASNVGINNKIIEEGVSGFLIDKEEDWETRIGQLLEDHILRSSMGRAGVQKIKADYSVAAHRNHFLQIFEGHV
jgi:glycosyltransferase involved in cell wall biosynthesis